MSAGKLTLAHNLSGIKTSGLPYAHLPRGTLDYYESSGWIVQFRDARGRVSGYCALTDIGQAMIAEAQCTGG